LSRGMYKAFGLFCFLPFVAWLLLTNVVCINGCGGWAILLFEKKMWKGGYFCQWVNNHLCSQKTTSSKVRLIHARRFKWSILYT
jgi:hypothetical protein